MAFLEPSGLLGTETIERLGLEVEEADTETMFGEVFDMVDPWEVADTDATACLRFSKMALERCVFTKENSMAEQGQKMRKVFREILLRRSFASIIAGKRIGDSLPCVQRINVDCEYTSDERVLYDNMYADESYKLFRKKDHLNNTGVVWSTTTYRKLCLMTSWLGMGYILDYKVNKLKEFRKNNGTAHTMLEAVRDGQILQEVPEDEQLDIPDEEDTAAIVKAHCNGSPKLRRLLSLLADIVVLERDKVIVWCNSPLQMEWLHCVSIVTRDAWDKC
jgi:hypothetical protein